MELGSSLYVPMNVIPTTPDAVMKSLTPDPTLSDDERLYVEIRMCVFVLYFIGFEIPDDDDEQYETRKRAETSQRVAWASALEHRVTRLKGRCDDDQMTLMEEYVLSESSATQDDAMTKRAKQGTGNASSGIDGDPRFNDTLRDVLMKNVVFDDEASNTRFLAYSKKIKEACDGSIIARRIVSNVQQSIEVDFGVGSTNWMEV